jgi:hypothetical protein
MGSSGKSGGGTSALAQMAAQKYGNQYASQNAAGGPSGDPSRNEGKGTPGGPYGKENENQPVTSSADMKTALTGLAKVASLNPMGLRDMSRASKNDLERYHENRNIQGTDWGRRARMAKTSSLLGTIDDEGRDTFGEGRDASDRGGVGGLGGFGDRDSNSGTGGV